MTPHPPTYTQQLNHQADPSDGDGSKQFDMEFLNLICEAQNQQRKYALKDSEKNMNLLMIHHSTSKFRT